MSNYNSQLQSNNIDLQTVLQTLQTKAAGGVETCNVTEVTIDNGRGLVMCFTLMPTSVYSMFPSERV